MWQYSYFMGTSKNYAFVNSSRHFVPRNKPTGLFLLKESASLLPLEPPSMREVAARRADGGSF